jgi:hypothetical protein
MAASGSRPANHGAAPPQSALTVGPTAALRLSAAGSQFGVRRPICLPGVGGPYAAARFAIMPRSSQSLSFAGRRK